MHPNSPTISIPSTNESPTGPRIELRTRNGGRQVFPLDKPVVRIGRLASNDVILAEEWVSKKHAEIRVAGDRYDLCDLESKSGVYVNGKQVSEHALEDGDVVRFGNSDEPTVVFRIGDTVQSDLHASQSNTNTSVILALESSTGKRDLKELSQFLEFNRLLGGQLTTDEILPNAVDLAMEMTQAERGFLIQKQSDGGIDFRVARTRSGAEIPTSEIAVSRSIVKDALDTGKPQVIPDVLETERLIGRESVAALDLRSVVAMPLTRIMQAAGDRPRDNRHEEELERETFGVLYLDSREAREAFGQIARDILEALARDVSSVIENTRLLREAEIKRGLEDELRRAKEVQAALLPGTFPSDPCFEAAGSCIPSHHLGGDYYDRFLLPDGRRCFVMADVVGHGPPAALLAAALQGILAAETANDQSLEQLTDRINRALCRIAPEGKYATLFVCVLSDDGTLTYVNAGHPPPRLCAPDGSIRQLSTGNLFVGMFEEHRYRSKTETMRPGDALVIYTDGVTEAADTAGDFFEDARLDARLASSTALTAQEIHDAIQGDVERFTGAREALDDITLLVVKYLGPGRMAGA